jgi:hypothetical protein
MTQAGQTTIYDFAETTLGQTPASPAGTQIRFVSESLNVAPTLSDSNEVTPGNEPEDSVITGFEGGGEIQIQFSPLNYDRYFSALLWNGWDWENSDDVAIRTSGSNVVTYTASTRTLTLTTGVWEAEPVNGAKIIVAGSGNAYLDGIHTVESWTTTTIVLEQDGILSNTAKVPNISSGRNIRIRAGEVLTNSLVPIRQSLGIEKRVERVSGSYLGGTATPGAPDVDYTVYNGVIPQRIALQATGDSSWTGSISVRASRQTSVSQANGGTTVLTSTTAYEATPIFQGINSVKKCRFFFADMSGASGDAGKLQDTLRICPQSIALEFNNNLQSTALMCAEPEFDFQQGEPLATCTVTGIYETPFALRAFEQQYAGVFELALVATDGHGYLFRFPRAKFTGATSNVQGRGTTIQINMTVKAFRVASPGDADTGRAVEIYRFIPPS